MSAFVVSQAHIDYLLTAGIRYSSPALGADRVTWQARPSPPYPGSAGYEGWIAEVRANRRELDYTNADTVGAMLWAENHRSVSARYGELQATPEYRYRETARRVSAVGALKLLRCFEYQSCESADWEVTEAYRFCEGLRTLLIARLPGYEAAPWAIEDGEPA